MCENSAFKLPLITLFIPFKIWTQLGAQGKNYEKKKEKNVSFESIKWIIILCLFSAAVGLSIGFEGSFMKLTGASRHVTNSFFPQVPNPIRLRHWQSALKLMIVIFECLPCGTAKQPRGVCACINLHHWSLVWSICVNDFDIASDLPTFMKPKTAQTPMWRTSSALCIEFHLFTLSLAWTRAS